MAIRIILPKVINLVSGSLSKVSLKATGGTGPYTWSALSSLPTGVTLGKKGLLNCNIASKGTFNILIKVTDSKNAFVNKEFTLVVEDSLIVTSLNGKLFMYGVNSLGNLGNNSIIDRSKPVQTISGGNNWKQISCGSDHTAAIKKNGSLWMWGSNYYGELGDNTINHRSSPVQTISGGNNWKQVSCGDDHTAAIKNDGTLWIWGRNQYGQLGNNKIKNKSSPIQTISSGNNWKQVSCGKDHTAAIKTDGTLWLWGANGYLNGGTLGDNTNTPRSSPVQTITRGNNWQQVSCGSFHTAAIKTNGTLWCWGDNYDGQLGNGELSEAKSPVQTSSGGINWKQVSCGYLYTTAIKKNGTLWCWGNNYFGQLGDNSTYVKYDPVKNSDGVNWKKVCSGKHHTVAIKADGTLWGFGKNQNGQLGNNTTVNSSVPVQSSALAGNYIDIGAGLHTGAIRSL